MAGDRAGRFVRASYDGHPEFPAGGAAETGHDVEPLREQAVELFAGQLAADRVPSVRAIRAQLHVDQSRAQRLQDYLATRGASQPGRPKEVCSNSTSPPTTQMPRFVRSPI